MRFTAFITCILILLLLAVPTFAAGKAERGQDGIIVVRTVNLTPENENALQSLSDGTERNRELDKPCGMSEKELCAALKYDLVPYAGYFIEAEQKHGVNAAFLAAIAAQESGWGRY